MQQAGNGEPHVPMDESQHASTAKDTRKRKRLSTSPSPTRPASGPPSPPLSRGGRNAEGQGQHVAGETGRWLQRPSKSSFRHVAPGHGKRGKAESGSDAVAVMTPSYPSRGLKPAVREPLGFSLSLEQCRLLDLVLAQRKSVFFTGSAGTGKSTVLKQLISMLPAATTFVTASTGVAAVNIGGTTLHQFAGVGLGEATKVELAYQVLEARGSADRWQRAKVLIIDEISMIDADLFDKLDYVARVVRGKNCPFGGIQLVCCGDFFQLPPVSRRRHAARREITDATVTVEKNQSGDGRAARFCFEAHAWKEAIEVCVELTQVHRQQDTRFAAILNELRRGIVSPESERVLAACTQHNLFAAASLPSPTPHGCDTASPSSSGTETLVEPTRLYSTNKNVDELNHQRLSALPGKGAHPP